LWRWTGLEKPGGKSTVYIRTSLSGNPAMFFDRSGVIVSCAIRELIVREANTNIGIDLLKFDWEPI
jgi:hypothetical protein